MQSPARFERRSDRIHIVGDLDMASAPHLRAALAGCDGQAVAVDLAGVTFIDSSGIHALERARREHRNLRIENPTDAVRRVFEIAGVTALLLGDGAGNAG
jgi:anti-anti-sigma factor